jgi:hypothetical protein
MIKYPKTPRLSKLTGCQEMFDWQPYQAVVEEKVDGANTAVSFEDGRLVLQSRGHVLSGGPRERLFERMWPWAYERLDGLRGALGGRYVAFGEWVYAKNRVYYDALPDFFIEFDVWDREAEHFLSTPRRRELLKAVPLVSVAVLWEGTFRKADAFSSFIGPSRYKTGRWKDHYKAAMKAGMAEHYAESETDDSLLMEGVYVKIEDDEKVIGRMKVLREDYEKVKTDDQKWGRRPLFPNRCREGP